MYSRCLVCHHPFPANETLEHFPYGERIAFDPERGRLWAVCRACRRWSLAPIEQRWEALEELEKLVVDRGRLLSQTDNIALLRVGPLEIVRVGRADLTEEAWWRYGKELTRRRDTYRRVSLAGAAAAGAVMAGGWATGGMSFIAMWIVWSHVPDRFTEAARWLRFGSHAWRGEAACDRCGHVFRSVPFRDRGGLFLLPGPEEGSLEVSWRCPSCGQAREGGLRLTDRDAQRTLQRVLAYQHFSGASERRVRSATRLIEEAGSARHLARIVVRDGRRLLDLQRTGAIALEIAAHEASEQRLLEMELAELESVWRREEELASIVDGELTPLPFLETVRRRIGGGG